MREIFYILNKGAVTVNPLLWLGAMEPKRDARVYIALLSHWRTQDEKLRIRVRHGSGVDWCSDHRRSGAGRTCAGRRGPNHLGAGRYRNRGRPRPPSPVGKP